jgi:hypothetical protein
MVAIVQPENIFHGSIGGDDCFADRNNRERELISQFIPCFFREIGHLIERAAGFFPEPIVNLSCPERLFPRGMEEFPYLCQRQ